MSRLRIGGALVAAVCLLSLVVHERADDYKTDPTGNVGKRIACGVMHR